jgi:hypothetical protein
LRSPVSRAAAIASTAVHVAWLSGIVRFFEIGPISCESKGFQNRFGRFDVIKPLARFVESDRIFGFDGQRRLEGISAPPPKFAGLKRFPLHRVEAKWQSLAPAARIAGNRLERQGLHASPNKWGRGIDLSCSSSAFEII